MGGLPPNSFSSRCRSVRIRRSIRAPFSSSRQIWVQRCAVSPRLDRRRPWENLLGMGLRSNRTPAGAASSHQSHSLGRSCSPVTGPALERKPLVRTQLPNSRREHLCRGCWHVSNARSNTMTTPNCTAACCRPTRRRWTRWRIPTTTTLTLRCSTSCCNCLSTRPRERQRFRSRRSSC